MLRSSGKVLAAFFVFLVSGTGLTAQEPLNRVLLIFDDSYSMYSSWNSNVKIEVAKRVMVSFLDSLAKVPNLELALRCYGHTTFFRPNRNCKDSKLEVPFAAARSNAPKIRDRILRLQPMGTTPIAYSLGESANDFPECTNCRNIVILITDGIEECGGDPCKVSLELQRKGIFIRPFVIGVGLEVKFADYFACVGKFYDVSNEANFHDVLRLVISEALTQTTVQVDLLDVEKKPTETDVDMTFYECATGKVKYNYLHTINHRGNPDTLVLDPNTTYDLEVHTIPPVVKKGIALTKGRHNVIPLDAPQGFIRLELEGSNSKYFPTTVIRRSGDMKTLNVQEFGKTEKYIVGKYDLEVLTLPRINLHDVEVKQSSVNTLRVPASGSVLFSKPGSGYGSVYVDDGKQVTWVCNLSPSLPNEIIYLQPGRYKAVFRVDGARETLRTVEKNFEVKAGVAMTVRLL
jgi:Ca-activated chloride channel homolog